MLSFFLRWSLVLRSPICLLGVKPIVWVLEGELYSTRCHTRYAVRLNVPLAKASCFCVVQVPRYTVYIHIHIYIYVCVLDIRHKTKALLLMSATSTKTLMQLVLEPLSPGLVMFVVGL